MKIYCQRVSAGSFSDRAYGPEACTRPAHCRTAEAGQQTQSEAPVEDRGNCDCRDCDSDVGVAVLRAYAIESPAVPRAGQHKEPATTRPKSGPAAGLPIPVIFISGHGDIPMSVRAMKAPLTS